jgi:dihydrofolate reductase
MRKINVTNNVTLDGVMQAPGSANEDTRNGFTCGGWAAPYHDEVKMRIMGRGMARRGALLFGRHTYEHFFKVWPGRTDNPYTEVLDNTQKYVVSRTLNEPLPWKNSTLLKGDAEETVAALKEDSDVDLTILGSGELVRSLVRSSLIDQFILLIHPLILGAGQRMFGDDGTLAKFTLTESVPTTTGVIIATYERA